jgi:peptidoglycan/LPS O-acetylase OafA/YrhL
MKRIPELDAIRGLAAVTILVYHLWIWISDSRWWFLITAVDCFFVLSGFLITGIILRYLEAPRFVLRFYARRGLRIWPIYYLYILTVFAIGPLLAGPSRALLPTFLTFTQYVDFHWRAPPPETWYGGILVSHTWTLALEEQFYLIWPALVLLAGRRRLVPMCLALAAVSATARGCGLFDRGPLLARCDGFALGGLLAALLADRERVARHLGRATGLFLGVIAVGVSYRVWGSFLHRRGWLFPHAPTALFSLNLFVFNLIYFGIVGLASCQAGRPWLAPLRDRRLTYLGQISYGLYLYHPLVYTLADRGAGRLGLGPSLALDALKLAACVAVASLSWRFIEKPILALKDVFVYRPEGAGDVAVGPTALPVAARAPAGETD